MDISLDDNICRICFHRQDTVFSLFCKIKGLSPYEKLIKKTQLKIELNDNGPASICSQCLLELDTTVNFLEKCEKSNQILTARLSQSKVFTNLSPVEAGENLYLNNSENNFDKKLPENQEYVSEENSCSQTPVEIEQAKCSVCGSLRRCKHWTPPSTYTCQYCDKVFTKKFNFKLHLKRHLGEKDWPCTTCGVRLLTRWLAQRHCMPKPRRTCPVPGCGKTFTTNTNLTTHMRTHSGERPHACMECGKSFTCKNSLNDHLRIHTGDSGYALRKTMMTPILNTVEGTPQNYYYGLHVTARNCVERCIGVLKARFRCLLVARALHYKPTVAARIVNACCVLHNIANATNAAIPLLTAEEVEAENLLQQETAAEANRILLADEAHNRRVNRDLLAGRSLQQALIDRLWRERDMCVKPYICPVCGRRFTTNKLAAHLRAHAGARPHACAAPACARSFASRRAARLHAATHAPPARAHACALCPAAYNHTQSLRKHMRQRHAQEPPPPSEGV